MTTMENIKETYEKTLQVLMESYVEAEAKLLEPIRESIIGVKVESAKYGPGVITAVNGTKVDFFIVDVKFEDSIQRFSLKHILEQQSRLAKITDEHILSLWSDILDTHNKLTAELHESEQQARVTLRESGQKLKDEMAWEARLSKRRQAALKEFDRQSKEVQEKPLGAAEDFYYSLGWLAKHVGAISAALPDYLLDAFEKQFGTDTGVRVVDSSYRTSGGFPTQWALSMRATVRGKDTLPANLTEFTNEKQTALVKTSFIWDLIDKYGFKFGKTQDIDNIKNKIPTTFVPSFELGYQA